MASKSIPGQPTLSGSVEKLFGGAGIGVQFTAFFDTPKSLYTTGVCLGEAGTEEATFEGAAMTVLKGIGEQEFKDQALRFDMRPLLLQVEGESVKFSVINFYSTPGYGTGHWLATATLNPALPFEVPYMTGHLNPWTEK